MAERTPDPARPFVDRAERLFADLGLAEVRAWKDKHPGRPALGHLPVYAPRELMAACETLPVTIVGGGDQIDIVRGDACFQSYICHIPRSIVELGLGGELAPLDGMVCPSTCDVIRNLSGMWQVLFPDKASFYLDLPQTFDPATGGVFYKTQLLELARLCERLGGLPLDDARLATTIRAYNANRAAIARLYDQRSETPWLVPADEAYLIVRAGSMLGPDEHTQLVDGYVAAAAQRRRRPEDRIRVLMVGSFCETPPLGLLRTLERAGCYVIDDDLNLGARWIEGDVVLGPGQGALDALVGAYLTQSVSTSIRYEPDTLRGPRLVDKARHRHADGVVFAAPSFCDPALLDQPVLQKALERAHIPYTLFKYAENNGQFGAVREQVGTFSDSIRLWGAA